jgi:hypothetical protein
MYVSFGSVLSRKPTYAHITALKVTCYDQAVAVVGGVASSALTASGERSRVC